ncbi:MAG: hypothetical protein ABI600_08870 [Luteolibacter sp.]
MKPLIPLMALAAALVLASAADEARSVVRFANNDQLSGSLESLTTDRLVWNSPILEKPAPFFLKNVLELKLTPAQPKIEAKYEATITLTNRDHTAGYKGDSIRGQLASITDDAVELDTWFAGRMKFRRVNIANIQIDEHMALVYQGPAGLDGWTQTEEPPAWTYRDSSFRSVAAGGIARNCDLPDECRVVFDAAWRGTFALKVNFFSDDLKQDSPESGYSMTFQQRSIFLQSGKNQLALGRVANAFALQENEMAKIEIHASSKSGQIAVFIDGKCIALWKDPDVAANKIGRGIHFVTLNASPVRISNIQVGAWDGVVDDAPEPQPAGGIRQFGGLDLQEDQKPPAAEKAANGRMMLRNGDSLVGEIVSIAGDMISIKTPFKQVRLPVERLKTIALKPSAIETCKRENGDVRGWFPDGTSIVFRLESVGDGTLSGTNQNFGSAVFKIAAFSRIEFNIYDPQLEELRNTGTW